MSAERSAVKTLAVSEDTHRKLEEYKAFPSMSFDDLIRDMVKQYEPYGK